MKFLLDTSIFLWYISKDERLHQKNIDIIRDENNEFFLSAISIWECVIKEQIGKLKLPEPTVEYLIEQREMHFISSLQLEEKCLTVLPQLPLIHRDPFDRILICQAKFHQLTLVTSDKIFSNYPVTII